MLKQSTLVLDYGCGIGRIAKAIIDKHQCRVIGADISVGMRALAADYVKSPRFLACHPDLLMQPCDVALAIWIIQHVRELDVDIARIADNLRDRGRLFIVNEKKRCVPTNVGWVNDGKDTRKAIGKRFDLLSEGYLDPAVVGAEQSKRTFWAIYQKKN